MNIVTHKNITENPEPEMNYFIIVAEVDGFTVVFAYHDGGCYDDAWIVHNPTLYSTQELLEMLDGAYE